MKRVWTEDKINFLKNNWEKYTDDQLAQKLKVSKQAILKQRQRLNILRTPPKPIKNTKQYSYKEVKDLFEKRGYKLITQTYSKYTDKLTYICNKHSNAGEQQITFVDFLRDRGCNECGRERTVFSHLHSDEYYKSECEKRGFIFHHREIHNQHSVIYFICTRHPEHGIQSKDVSNFEVTQGCKFCAINVTENRLNNILNEWGYPYVTQKRFQDCKDKRALPFDVYIEQLNIAIEYDGEFHYMPIRKGSMTDEEALKQFEKTKYHDAIKTQYCIDNNINLIRIPYWEQDNMEHFLWSELVKYKAIINDKIIFTK